MYCNAAVYICTTAFWKLVETSKACCTWSERQETSLSEDNYRETVGETIWEIDDGIRRSQDHVDGRKHGVSPVWALPRAGLVIQHKEHSAIFCPSPRMEVAQVPDPCSFLFKVLVKQGHLGQVPVCLCKVRQKHKEKANTKEWQHQTIWDGYVFIKYKNLFCCQGCQISAFLGSIIPVMSTDRSKAGLSAAKQSMAPTGATWHPAAKHDRFLPGHFLLENQSKLKHLILSLMKSYQGTNTTFWLEIHKMLLRIKADYLETSSKKILDIICDILVLFYQGTSFCWSRSVRMGARKKMCLGERKQNE